jgi:NhaC family Na+:H+ antiporter
MGNDIGLLNIAFGISDQGEAVPGTGMVSRLLPALKDIAFINRQGKNAATFIIRIKELIFHWSRSASAPILFRVPPGVLRQPEYNFVEESIMNTVRFTGPEVFSLLLVTLIGVLCSAVFQYPLVIGFMPGFIVLFCLGLRKKRAFRNLIHICLRGMNKTKIVIIILFLVGFLLPSWSLSGTISQMVTVSLNYITPGHFFILSFLISLIFSMILGTSIGTLSSIGVPIMGTAAILHLPAEIAAGALISGAFVGDRTSPFSSSHQLLAHTVEIPVKRQFKAMLTTTIIAVLIGIVFYSALDIQPQRLIHNTDHSFQLSELSLVKFIPPLLLLLFVIFRSNIINAFLSSIISALIIAGYHGTSFTKMAGGLFYGINGLGGGLVHMYQLLLFLALAGAYNGLLEELHVIQPFLDKWLKASRSLVGDTFITIFASLFVSLISANQTLPIILTGRSFLPHWSEKFSKEELARVMGDSTSLFPGMVPWSVLTIMCSTITGVSVYRYLPYAIFLWILPILTLALSFYKHIKGKLKSTAA